MKELARSGLTELLKRWARDCRVLVPIRADNGDLLLDVFDEATWTLAYGKTPSLAKSLLLPQNETIFAFSRGAYREFLDAPQTILFGIRPCDLMGYRQSSHFMARGSVDPYFRAKKEAVRTVVMACPGPQNTTCFCTTMQTGPVARHGFDLQLFDLGGAFLVETGSERGEALLEGFPLTEVDAADAAGRRAAFCDRAVAEVGRAEAVPEAMQRLRERSVDDGVWETFGRQCIQCGGCAFVCPTCTCFNVWDRITGPEEGTRERSWDTCLFGGFTREASGHNPRPTQALRLKRRHEHKLIDYQDEDIQDALCGCTGCGRCSDFCPVRIGTLEVAGAIVASDRRTL
jgi:ferredoxin